jgi:lipoprotein-anchoring transpeptidase ErfK/SrfK
MRKSEVRNSMKEEAAERARHNDKARMTNAARGIYAACVVLLTIFAGAPSGRAQSPVAPATPPVATGTETNPATPPAPSLAAPSPAGTNAPVPSPSPAATTAEPANEPKVAKAEPVEDVDVYTRLQIFLDQQNFGPGKIDGRAKLFTAQALDRYRQAHGLPVNGKIDADIPLDSVHPIITTYEIEPDDLKYAGDVPSKPALQSKLKYLCYPSLLEFVGERYHSDPDFLAKINKGKDLEKLKPGDIVRVPNVEPFKIEDLVESPSLPAKPEFVNRVLNVDTKNCMIDLLDGDKLLASYPITPGSAKLPAPKGIWKILGICELPNFRWDEAMLEHGVRSSDFYMLQKGPRNPVGVMWMGLNKPGIGIHGTASPWNIGRTGSHGCIRLANWDIIRLAPMVTEGMKVIIR